MLDRWHLENTSQGAKSCIILGEAPELLVKHELEKYSQVLWLIDNDFQCSFTNIQTFCLKDLDSEDFKESLQLFIAKDYQSIPDTKSYKSLNPIWNQVLETINLNFECCKSARRTRSEDGLLRQINIFQNLPDYLISKIDDRWKNSLEKTLSVVVGAGPSLDLTLPILKKWKIPFNLIATDSSIRALNHFDLKPDFVLSIDPNKCVQSCADYDFNDGILIACNTTHKSWLERWKNNTMMISGPIIFEDWLEKNGIEKAEVQAINNVGLSSISFANFLGCEVLMLIGMDLASGLDHSRYAVVTQRDQNLIPYGTKQYEIPGNFNKKVKTTFISDWKDTSNFCKQIAEKLQIINLNDRGAVLEGALLIHPSSAMELEETLSNFIEQKTNPLDLINRYQSKPQNLDFIFEKIFKAIDRAWFYIENNSQQEESFESKQYDCIRKIMTDSDLPSIMGDYSFAVMPLLISNEMPSKEILETIINNLKMLLWKLEDALIQLPVSNKLMAQFLTENLINSSEI